MNRKTKFTLVCFAVFLFCLFVWYERPRSRSHCITRTHELQQKLLNFSPTNIWKDIQAAGGHTSGIIGIISGRTRFQYFLMQVGDSSAAQELGGIFENHKRPKIGEGSFSYFSDLDWRAFKMRVPILDGRAAELAPWWNKTWRGECAWVSLSTNSSGTAWEINMYCISDRTNSVLLTHIYKGTVD